MVPTLGTYGYRRDKNKPSSGSQNRTHQPLKLTLPRSKAEALRSEVTGLRTHSRWAGLSGPGVSVLRLLWRDVIRGTGTQKWRPVPPCVATGRSQPCLLLGSHEMGALLIFGFQGPSVWWHGTSEPMPPLLSPAGTLMLSHYCLAGVWLPDLPLTSDWWVSEGLHPLTRV